MNWKDLNVFQWQQLNDLFLKSKDVTDLDVVVQKGKKAYNKLRDSGLCKIDIAKISKDERLILALKKIYIKGGL